MSTKKRGRPRTGINLAVGVRLPPRLLRELDRWRAQELSPLGRPEAIRRLLEECLLIAKFNKGDQNGISPSVSSHIKNGARKSLTLFGAQCRAARALLNWSQEDLARRSKVAKKTIADFERGVTQPRAQTLTRISAFDTAGIEFLSLGCAVTRRSVKDSQESG